MIQRALVIRGQWHGLQPEHHVVARLRVVLRIVLTPDVEDVVLMANVERIGLLSIKREPRKAHHAAPSHGLHGPPVPPALFLLSVRHSKRQTGCRTVCWRS